MGQRRGDEYARIGAVLRAARVHLGYTQLRCAEQIGVSEGTYSRYESGKQKITIPELKAISALLGLRVADVVAGDVSEAMENMDDPTRTLIEQTVKETLAQLGLVTKKG